MKFSDPTDPIQLCRLLTTTIISTLIFIFNYFRHRHAVFEYITKDNQDEVFLTPCGGAQTFVNGRLVDERIKLKTGMRIIFGAAHVFRFVHPSKIHIIINTTDPPDESPTGNNTKI